MNDFPIWHCRKQEWKDTLFNVNGSSLYKQKALEILVPSWSSYHYGCVWIFRVNFALRYVKYLKWKYLSGMLAYSQQKFSIDKHYVQVVWKWILFNEWINIFVVFRFLFHSYIAMLYGEQKHFNIKILEWITIYQKA